MQTISTKIIGDLIVSEDTTYHHVLLGSVTIEKGITARFYGDVSKDIIVKENATVYLHGTLLGKVNNQGGIVYVFKSNGSIETYKPSKEFVPATLNG